MTTPATSPDTSPAAPGSPAAAGLTSQTSPATLPPLTGRRIRAAVIGTVGVVMLLVKSQNTESKAHVALETRGVVF